MYKRTMKQIVDERQGGGQQVITYENISTGRRISVCLKHETEAEVNYQVYRGLHFSLSGCDFCPHATCPTCGGPKCSGHGSPEPH